MSELQRAHCRSLSDSRAHPRHALLGLFAWVFGLGSRARAFCRAEGVACLQSIGIPSRFLINGCLYPRLQQRPPWLKAVAATCILLYVRRFQIIIFIPVLTRCTPCLYLSCVQPHKPQGIVVEDAREARQVSRAEVLSLCACIHACTRVRVCVSTCLYVCLCAYMQA